jgi:hypothetical protein
MRLDDPYDARIVIDDEQIQIAVHGALLPVCAVKRFGR